MSRLALRVSLWVVTEHQDKVLEELELGRGVSSWTISAFELCGLRTSLRFPLDAVLLVGILPQDKSRRKR